MQEQHLDQLLRNTFGNEDMHKALRGERQQVDMSLFRQQAEIIEKQTTNLPEGMRTPNSDEVYNMQKFANDYRKQSPKASKREIRRALLRKFNVQILPDTVNI